MTPDRRRFLGGSDVAAVMGLSPWKTPVELYHEKTSTAPPGQIDEEKRRFFARRKRQEPVIAEMLADERGIEITRLSLDEHPNRYIDLEHDFLAAEVDFEFRQTARTQAEFPTLAHIAMGETVNGEIKTVHPFKSHEWGEEGSEEIPIHYAAQAMHGMAVTMRKGCVVAALFGLDSLVCFPIVRDDETIAGMREREVAFWRDHVLAGVPPEPMNVGDLRLLYATVNGRVVEISAAVLEDIKKLEELRAFLTTSEKQKKELEFEIGKAIADAWGTPAALVGEATDNAVLTYGGREVATWKRQRGASLDQRRLKFERPEIIEAFTREFFYRTVRTIKPKKGKA